MSGIVNSVKELASNVSETIQADAHKVAKEGEKEVAKNSEAPIEARVHAAGEAPEDKIKQHEQEAKAEVHKQAE